MWARHQRRWFGKWHLYLGIIAGAILCVVGLTGSVLVFQDEIDAALNPSLFEVSATQQKIPLENIVSLVRERYPDRQFEYVMDTRPDATGGTYRFYRFDTKEEFFVNPYTAEVLGGRPVDSAFIRIILNIHTTLLVPVAGKYITGIAALCMLILTISGLRLWLPAKWKQLRAAMKVNFRTSGKRQNYDWHNVLGLYSSPVIILLSLTGFAITFSAPVIALIFLINGKSPAEMSKILAAKSERVEGGQRFSEADAAKKGYALFPEGKLIGMAVPRDTAGVYRLDMRTEGASRTGNRVMLQLDQYSGKVLLNSEENFPNSGNSYLSWLTPLHYGTFGGMPTRILALLGGLIPLALYVTGFIIWWPRMRKNKSPKAPKTPKEPPVPAPFLQVFGKGFRYAGWVLLCAAAAGALYGLLSGIIAPPAVFAILYTTILIVLNFFVALLAILFNALFLAPFRRWSRGVAKYFALSLAFMIVFVPVVLFINWTGLKIF
ncbi:PepSY domain-containing protein [Chitinophaga sp.]|uniref:PepSY-associated TM helix domain-containing protein n=1 Tax=Chitinophaga sp. TaxID=1869181 RepID=UPI00260BB728|nr:PepSY-associated TM helix domain-containing protein [uncultured Chitinophaga sp.]